MDGWMDGWGAEIAMTRVTRQTQQEVAVKTFSREMLSKEGNAHLLTAMRNELAVLTALRDGKHPSVANLVAVHEGPVQLVCCLEYCGGGSLHKALQRAGACDRPHAFGLGEHVSVRVARQLASALAFMHGAGFAHRDVKPQNVLFTEAPPNITPAAASRAPKSVSGSSATISRRCVVSATDWYFSSASSRTPTPISAATTSLTFCAARARTSAPSPVVVTRDSRSTPQTRAV